MNGSKSRSEIEKKTSFQQYGITYGQHMAHQDQLTDLLKHIRKVYKMRL